MARDVVVKNFFAAGEEALNRRAAGSGFYFAAAFSFAASSFARAVTYARTASISD